MLLKTTSDLNFDDYLGALRVRVAIKRDCYTVEPGLYELGNPDKKSPVFVSANYKLSFDTLRKNLSGIHCYILVLDTKGINVWCAAGKGTFGTSELCHRIENSGLKDRVSHRRLIVPQLGAPGVAAHEIVKKTGFSVIYGPVRASDIKEFLANGQATQKMRTVLFSFYDRIILIPVELKAARNHIATAALVSFLLPALKNHFSDFSTIADGSRYLMCVLAGFFGGIFLGPGLLPLMPGKSFSLKGICSGIIMFLVAYYSGITGNTILEHTAHLFIITALSSFYTMNFTGCSTYTSLSGVEYEMKRYIPLQIAMLCAGILLIILKIWGIV